MSAVRSCAACGGESPGVRRGRPRSGGVSSWHGKRRGDLQPLILAHIRSYNRIAIYIAFLSLFAVAWFAERLRQLPQEALGVVGFHVGLAALTVVGILDQTSPPHAAARASSRAAFENDAKLVAAIEARLPEGSMIYEIPYLHFPEASSYNLLRPYLHSRRLRWSHGTMRGRLGDDWHCQLAEKSLPERLEMAALAGFSGVLFDREGGADGAAGLETDIATCLGAPSLVSDSGQFAFFELCRLQAALEQRYTEAERARHREALLQPVTFAWSSGFRWIEETPKRIRYRWCAADATMIVSNPLPRSRRIEIYFSIDAPESDPCELSIRSDLFDADVQPTGAEVREVKRVVEVRPGEHVVQFQLRRWWRRAPGPQVFDCWDSYIANRCSATRPPMGCTGPLSLTSS